MHRASAAPATFGKDRMTHSLANTGQRRDGFLQYERLLIGVVRRQVIDITWADILNLNYPNLA
jgi:hypothetical protein